LVGEAQSVADRRLTGISRRYATKPPLSWKPGDKSPGYIRSPLRGFREMAKLPAVFRHKMQIAGGRFASHRREGRPLTGSIASSI
jgi:hypothetical protein